MDAGLVMAPRRKMQDDAISTVVGEIFERDDEEKRA